MSSWSVARGPVAIDKLVSFCFSNCTCTWEHICNEDQHVVSTEDNFSRKTLD
jgi:hypothetical protein